MKYQPKFGGTVTPPADMVEAAKKTLGDRYDEFVTKYPGEITPQKLCKFVEEIRWHSDSQPH